MNTLHPMDDLTLRHIWGQERIPVVLGRYHGAGNDGSWFEISDTFATRWGDQDVACRLMTAT
jgi:hypothetical protein